MGLSLGCKGLERDSGCRKQKKRGCKGLERESGCRKQKIRGWRERVGVGEKKERV